MTDTSPPTASFVDLIAIMLTATLVGTAMSLGYPLFSIVMENTGFDRWVIGLISAAQGVGTLTIAPLAPAILARLKARRTMQLGLILAVVAILLKPLWIQPVFWFALRVILGMGTGLIFIVSEASVNALADNKKRGRILGIYATLFCIGYASGPAIILIAGTKGFMPFFLSAVLLLAGLIPAGLARAADRALDGPQLNLFSMTMLRTLANAKLPFFTIFIFGLVEASVFGFLPLYGLDFGLVEKVAALMLTVWIAGNIVLQYPIGVLSDRISRKAVLTCCALISGLTFIMLPWAINGHALVWPLLIVQGSAMGGLYVLALAILGERFQGSILAVANTGFVVSIEVGLIIGPALTGAAISAVGSSFLPWLLAAFFVVLTAVTGRAWLEERWSPAY